MYIFDNAKFSVLEIKKAITKDMLRLLIVQFNTQ